MRPKVTLAYTNLIRNMTSYVSNIPTVSLNFFCRISFWPVDDQKLNFFDIRPKCKSVIDENRRRIGEYKRTFLQLVDSEDSGFYSYNDAKGQTVCLGYDNYGVLLESTSNNRSRLMDASLFNTETVDLNINDNNRLLVKIDLRQRQLEQKRHSVHKSPDLVLFGSVALLKAKLDDENKLCNDTLKAQTIRNLTFKNVTTY